MLPPPPLLLQLLWTRARPLPPLMRVCSCCLGPGCQGYALPKAVALVSPARRAQTFKILGFFSEAEEARLQYKTES